MSDQDPNDIADQLEDVLDDGLRETMDARQTADRLRQILPDLREAMNQTKRELVQEMKEEDHFEILVEETPTFESLFGGLYETRYTKLLEWFLKKENDISRKVLEALFQESIQREKISDNIGSNSSKFQVEAETNENSGRPDLRIESEQGRFLIYVEIKTGADETNNQLERYAKDLEETSSDNRFLICLCSDESTLQSVDEVNQLLGSRYQKRSWFAFLRTVKQSIDSVDISDETELMLRILTRDRVLAAADLADNDQEKLRNLHDQEELAKLDLDLNELQNLRDAVMELQKG